MRIPLLHRQLLARWPGVGAVLRQALLLLIALNGAPAARAEPASSSPTMTLSQAFEQAWQRHPAFRALADRRAAGEASRQAAHAWTAQPLSLDLRTQDDRVGSDRGAREVEAGVVLPLWLPGQRHQAQQLAEGESQALEARIGEARLVLAGLLRDAWWAWHRANVELQLAQARMDHAQALLADVRRRVQAGDLARSDQHQAEGALASAEASRAQGESQRSQSWQALAAWLAVPGVAEPGMLAPQAEAVDSLTEGSAPSTEDHPTVLALGTQAMASRRAAELAATQVRANPELSLGTVQSRDVRGEGYQRALMLGLKVPLGSSPAQAAQAARARADASEIEAQLELARLQVARGLSGAQTRLRLAKQQQDATWKRARLAQENLAFFDKSFRLGETDLPTRLRITLEAQEAERQDALARVDVSAATSALRQAAGLLPE